MDFKRIRNDLAYWGISAPESDDELAVEWIKYKKLLQRKIRQSWLLNKTIK